MEPINQQSTLQKINTPFENGQTSFSSKQVSNKNYLVKQTSSLNPILSANKKTLNPQENSWTTATKAVLVSTGVLGLGYLSYQYLGTKSTPSPSLLPHISIGNLLRTTIKVIGGLGLLTLVYSALGKKEHAKPINNHSIGFQKKEENLENKIEENLKAADGNLENTIIKNLKAAEENFSKNIYEFVEVCEGIIFFLDTQKFSESFIQTFLASIQKKLTNPDERVSNHMLFSIMIEKLFNKLLVIDKNSALELAKTCVKVKDSDNREESYLFTFCKAIIMTALNSKKGYDLAVYCAKEKNILRCEEVAKKAAVIYFNNDDFRFEKLLNEIALADNENLLESILNTFFNEDNILIKAKNYKMVTSLLEKCVATENKKLQDLAKIMFYVHKNALLKASPDSAKQLLKRFEKLEHISTDDDSDDFTEKVTTEYLENLKKNNRYLDG